MEIFVYDLLTNLSSDYFNLKMKRDPRYFIYVDA